MTHQPRTMFDYTSGRHTQLAWDANDSYDELKFVVVPDSQSSWNGRIVLWSNVYYAGTAAGGNIKDIHLSFTLERK